MALEQGARRTEPFLAEAHSLAGEGIVDFQQMNREAAPAQVESTTMLAQQQDRANPREDAATSAQGSSERPSSASDRADARPSGVAPVTPRFDMPEVLAQDIFQLLPLGLNEPARIVVDEPKPSGIVFSVQIGAFRNPIPTDLFDDIIPVMGESAGGGLTRYTAGLFNDYGAADRARLKVRDRGYRDAFVVAYRDGVRITLAEALGSQPAGPATAEAPRTQPALRLLAGDSAVITITQVREPATIRRPSEVGAPTSSSDQQVLASYPPTADAIIGQFQPAPEAAAYYNDPSAAPARQVELVKGLFFTVQVGVYSKPVALDKLFNIDPLNTELTEKGKIRYTTGVYLDTERARIRKDQAVTLGVKDAFVTAYLNGKRIPMLEARALLAKHGAAILADPSISTR